MCPWVCLGSPPGDIEMLCASRHPRQIVCAGNGGSRHRLSDSKAVRASRRSARPRPRLASAERHYRPPRFAANPPARVGPNRDACGARRGAPARLRAPALPRIVHRQHRHVDTRLFQREGRPACAAVADRRRARRQRPCRVLRQHAADGASRPRVAAGRARPPPPDRAGLSADRGSVAARRAEGGRGGARPPPGTAGMDRPGVARDGAAGPLGPMRCAGRMPRRPRPIFRRRPRRASVARL